MATKMQMEAIDPLVEPHQGLTRAGARRLNVVDMLRGLMIVLMVLDHVRDFFGMATFHDPTDPDTSWPLLYATRWITHLCAPTFVLLTGVSIFLQAQTKAPATLSRFLVARGAWLVLLEITVVSFGFNFGEPFLFLQVIWAIGFGMICMSLIARMPPATVLGIGVVILALCPWTAAASEDAAGVAAVLRNLLLAPGFLPAVPSLAMYPALPWLGIMCAGFGMGPIFLRPSAERARSLLAIALGMLVTFVVLRTLNGYGDPSPWTLRPNSMRTAMSFLNVSKYPPSPDYVLVTLGAALLLIPAMERLRGPVARILLDFGRTPLFTYLAHIYIAHGGMLVIAAAKGQPGVALNFLSSQTEEAVAPAAWGYSLGWVYLAWTAVILLLIPLAHKFARLKRERRDWWLSYI